MTVPIFRCEALPRLPPRVYVGDSTQLCEPGSVRECDGHCGGPQTGWKRSTREKFVQAIQSMNGVDIGLGPDARLKYSPIRHKGLGRVYPTVVRGGKPEVLTDWADVVTSRLTPGGTSGR